MEFWILNSAKPNFEFGEAKSEIDCVVCLLYNLTALIEPCILYIFILTAENAEALCLARRARRRRSRGKRTRRLLHNLGSHIKPKS
jgi:hypothetical protein